MTVSTSLILRERGESPEDTQADVNASVRRLFDLP